MSLIAPPPYNPYNPQPQGYQQQGYQQQGYQQQGYATPLQGYPPPQQGYRPFQQGYYPVPATPPVAVQQHTTNIVINCNEQQPILAQQPMVTNHGIQQSESKPKVNHVLHLLITFFIFPPWIFVWIAFCIMYEDYSFF